MASPIHPPAQGLQAAVALLRLCMTIECAVCFGRHVRCKCNIAGLACDALFESGCKADPTAMPLRVPATSAAAETCGRTQSATATGGVTVLPDVVPAID